MSSKLLRGGADCGGDWRSATARASNKTPLAGGIPPGPIVVECQSPDQCHPTVHSAAFTMGATRAVSDINRRVGT